MKKLMIAAVAIAFAAVAQAASVSWTLAKDDAKTYGDADVYAIDGANYATVIAALAAGGDSVSTTFNTYVVDKITANSRGAAGNGEANSPGTSLAFFIFKDNTIASGSTYDTTGVIDVSAYLYTPPQSAPGDLEMTVDSFALKNQTIASGGETPVEPEPTSALLMLCGLAGLALRRKRA